MSKEKSLDVQGIVERAKIFLELDTNHELANALNIKQNTVSAWKKRGSVNLALIITGCAGVNVNWLLYGTGTMREGQFDPVSGRVVAMLETMDKEQRRDVLRFTEKEQLICELQHELEARKKAA